MDHTFVSGIETSSVILNQIKYCTKLLIEPKPFKTYILMLSNAIYESETQYIEAKVDRMTWLHVPSGIYGKPAVILTKELKYDKETPTKINTYLKASAQSFKRLHHGF